MVLNPVVGSDADVPLDSSNNDEAVASRSHVIETMAEDLTLKEGRAVLEAIELRSINYSDAMERYEEGNEFLQEAIDRAEGIDVVLNSVMSQKRQDLISSLKLNKSLLQELNDYIHIEFEEMNK